MLIGRLADQPFGWSANRPIISSPQSAQRGAAAPQPGGAVAQRRRGAAAPQRRGAAALWRCGAVALRRRGAAAPWRVIQILS